MLPLIERYRHKDFDEVIGVEELDKIKKLIENPMDMPNLLFYGPQGTGKTTVAKIILSKLKPIDHIRINGSDTTGVDTIRDKVYNFMTSMSSVPDKPKLIWIEEFDFMSANAFAALRSMIEQFMSNARFICTCNYMSKIPEPIQSRFSCFEFKPLKTDLIFKKLKEIAVAEKNTMSDEWLKIIAEVSYGDLRTALNNFQANKVDEGMTAIDEIYQLLIDANWTKLRYELPHKNPDYVGVLVVLDQRFFDSDLEISQKVKVNNIIARALYEMNFTFNKEITFMAACASIMEALQ